MAIAHSALYYPSIEFVDPRWLWAAALVWDRIYRIVPKDYVPDDCDNVRRLTESGEIGIAIHPDDYTEAVAQQFMTKVNSGDWNAAALEGDLDEEYAHLHRDKVDVQLREMILAKGRGSSQDEWLHVPSDFGALYMTYLAGHIAERACLSLVTDAPAAWTGCTYFAFDGQLRDYPSEDLPQVLAVMLVRDFIPTNLLSIPPSAILSFRERRRAERHRFAEAVRAAAEQLANCRDPNVAQDMYEELKKDVRDSLEEYRRSMDVLKVEGWTGLKTLVFPAATKVLSGLFPLDETQVTLLSATGVAIGAVSGLASLHEKGRRLARDCEYSYLFNMQREWEKCYRGKDWNYYLCRQMEEFIED
jgi:hypothetical protein